MKATTAEQSEDYYFDAEYLFFKPTEAGKAKFQAMWALFDVLDRLGIYANIAPTIANKKQDPYLHAPVVYGFKTK